MSGLLRRLRFLFSLVLTTSLYLALFVSSGWDPRTDSGAFVLVVTALGASVTTIAGIAALWRVARGRSPGLLPLAAALGALGALITVALALAGMPVGTRGDRSVVYWTAIAATLGLLAIGWLVVRRR